MRADTTNGGINQLETHYQTFVVSMFLCISCYDVKSFQTEQDFAQIAGAGLNYVRIGLPFWAIETRGSEPFLANVAWTCVSVFIERYRFTYFCIQIFP